MLKTVEVIGYMQIKNISKYHFDHNAINLQKINNDKIWILFQFYTV